MMKPILEDYLKKTNNRINSRVIKKQYLKLYEWIFKETSFLKTENLAQRVYHIIYEIYGPKKCENCGGEVKRFISFNGGYPRFCSKKCANSNESKKEKTKKSMQEKYGVDNPMKVNAFKRKMVENTDYEKKQKSIQKTFDEKYGGHPMFCDAIKKKVVEKTDYKKRSETIKKTNLEKYGVENVFQSEEIKEKIKQTNLERYGVKNLSQAVEFKKIIKRNQKKVFFERMLKKLDKIVIPLFDFSMYHGVGYRKEYKWRCKECETIFFDHMDDGHLPKCPICNPKLNRISENENEIFNFINNNTKIQSNRTILNGKELDIYIPDKKLAIEFNGLYWHSELLRTDKFYHLNKTIGCEKNDVFLIHIFEHEWLKSKKIVKSFINSKLELFEEKIDVKNCSLKKITTKQRDIFLKKNCIICKTYKDVFSIGLFHKNELVSVMYFKQIENNNEKKFELVNFGNKINCDIKDSEAVLFDYFKQKCKPEYVVSYIDRRYPFVKPYENIGFKKVSCTDPQCYYFKGRSTFIPQSEIDLSENKKDLSEWDYMQKIGYNRIWDCGSFVYEWSNYH